MTEETVEGSIEDCDPGLVHTILLRFRNIRAVELHNLLFNSARLAAHASMITTAHIAPIDLDTLLLSYSTYRPLSADAVQLCTAWFGSVSTFIVRGDSKARLIGGAVLENLPARLTARNLTLGIPAHQGIRDRLHRSPTFGDQGTMRALHVTFAERVLTHSSLLCSPPRTCSKSSTSTSRRGSPCTSPSGLSTPTFGRLSYALCGLMSTSVRCCACVS
ncbi:hypothetical protein BDW22DRAFT_1227500 [Trametopsis cervina]|nr:hypothetical protein BDW22DRAFT_1227500 [Trametopsis cervina]